MPLLAVILSLQLPHGGAPALEGLWHNSTCVGSGYCELYALLPGGVYEWHENEMDGESRLRTVWGGWELRGDTLELTADSMLVWEGGRMIAATGSVGTDSQLVDFSAVIRTPAVRDTLAVGLSDYAMDSPGGSPDLPCERPGMDIAGKRFWRIATDPDVIRGILEM